MSRKILMTGSLGQIGSELAVKLRKIYGEDNVVVSNASKQDGNPLCEQGLFEVLDVTDGKKFLEIAKKHKINYIVHLAALLSATGEKSPELGHTLYRVGMDGLYNALEVCREMKADMFTPSSIAAFGPTTPMDMTPQDTICRPTTMYGVTKVAGELLCDYFYHKYGVDSRGLRYPGLISHAVLPGGGTTDYAVHIYYEALKAKSYASYIGKGNFMPMMYMPDAINAATQLMEADPTKLVHRNAFNVTSFSVDPEIMAASIKKVMPEFQLSYDVDPVRDAIAKSWPNSIDDSAARAEWGWKPEFDLDKMTVDMLENLKKKGIGQ